MKPMLCVITCENAQCALGLSKVGMHSWYMGPPPDLSLFWSILEVKAYVKVASAWNFAVIFQTLHLFFNCLPCNHLTGIRKMQTNNNIKETTPNHPQKHAVVTVNTWALVMREDSGNAHWIFSCLYGCQSGRWLKLYGSHVLSVDFQILASGVCVCMLGAPHFLFFHLYA